MGNFEVDYTQTLFMCILYLIIGIISILCSTLTISLYLSSRELRKKYVLYMIMDVCELIDAISYVLLGFGRGYELLSGTIGNPISVYHCFYTKFWPHLLILGTQLPSLCTTFISFERILAVVKPVIYKRTCTENFKLSFITLLPIFAMMTLFAAGMSVMGHAGEKISSSQHCAIITSTSRAYSTFHFLFIVIAPVISFTSTFIVWITRRELGKTSATKFGSKDDKFGIVLAMSGTSIILLASPAFVMLTISWDLADWNDIEVAITYAMPGFLSVVNTIITFKFRKELRTQLLYLFGYQKKVPTIHEHTHFTKLSNTSHINQNRSAVTRIMRV